MLREIPNLGHFAEMPRLLSFLADRGPVRHIVDPYFGSYSLSLLWLPTALLFAL